MKKNMALVLTAVILLASGIARVVYADSDHEPVHGQKLVGVGMLGTRNVVWGTIGFSTSFRFTNPDSVGDITIKKVSIIDRKGTVIYEGPFIRVLASDSACLVREIVTDPMGPHETRGIKLWEYIRKDSPPNPDDLTDCINWLTSWEAINLDSNVYGTHYTVEIEWKAKGKVCPLTGWQQTERWSQRNQGHFRAIGESPMVNLKQRRPKHRD